MSIYKHQQEQPTDNNDNKDAIYHINTVSHLMLGQEKKQKRFNNTQFQNQFQPDHITDYI